MITVSNVVLNTVKFLWLIAQKSSIARIPLNVNGENILIHIMIYKQTTNVNQSNNMKIKNREEID